MFHLAVKNSSATEDQFYATHKNDHEMEGSECLRLIAVKVAQGYNVKDV